MIWAIFSEKIEKAVSQETMELVWTAAFTGMYLHYDIGQEFVPQFESNSKSFFDDAGFSFFRKEVVDDIK